MAGFHELQRLGYMFIYGGPLFPHAPPQPTAARPLPSFILHNNKSTFYAPFTGQNGFSFFTVGTASMSDLLATTDNGHSGLWNLYFFNNGNAPITCGIYDRGVYVLSTRSHIGVSPGPANSYCIGGQYNDVHLIDLNLGCGDSGSTSALSISWTPETGTTNPAQPGDVEGIHGVIFDGGLINTKGCSSTGPSVAITGRSGAAAFGLTSWVNNNGGILGVHFKGTTFELNAQGVVLTDASDVTFDNDDISGTGTAFLTINQTYTPNLQAYGVGGISIVNSPISGWTDAVLNNVSTDPSATVPLNSQPWFGDYLWGGGTYSLTSGAPNNGVVVSDLPQIWGNKAPLISNSAITLNNAHVGFTQTTAPVATTCGGGTATGTDNSFKVTGIASGGTCTVTFNSAIKQGICSANSQSASFPVGITSCSTSAVTFNFSSGNVTTLYATAF
jgi:hypothetical protein